MQGVDLSGASFLTDWSGALARCADRPAFIQLDPHGEPTFAVSFEELDTASSRLAGALQATDANNQRTLLWLTEDYDLLVALLACFKSGRVAIPTARTARGSGGVAALLADCAPGLIVCGVSEATTLDASFAGLPRLEMSAHGPGSCLADPEPDACAYLQYTSGSTGRPRGVRITHRNIAYNTWAIAMRFDLSDRDRYCHWLPLFHDMGLVTTLTAMALGCPVFRLKPAHFARRPFSWLQAVERHEATVTGAPNFALELCAARAERLGRLDLSRVATLFSGSERIRSETVERFLAVFGPAGLRRDAIAPCYGLAEATLMVSGGRLSGATDRLDVSCGPPAPDSTVLVVDPDTGNLQADGLEGEIWVKGPGVSPGYYGTETSTGRFHKVSPTGETGFLRTGDLGRLVAGELYVRGRLDDIIVVEGRNLHLCDIETTVSDAHPTVHGRPGAALALDADRLAILQEARCNAASAGELARTIAVQVACVHGVSPARVIILRPGSLPLTTSGKVRRGACQPLLAVNSRHSIYDSTRAAATYVCDAAENAIEQLLFSLLSEATGRALHELDARRHFVDYGLSSSRAAEIVYRLSETVGMPLDTGILYEHPSISALAEYLRTRMPAWRGVVADPEGDRGYRTEARRPLADAMAAMALDTTYVRALGDYLYQADGTPVLDLVGGFGVTLLGHNPSPVVEAVRAALGEDRPLNAQGSIRAEAGRLAQSISRRLGERLPRRFVTSLWSTGAEAVEAARRHALLAYRSCAAGWLRNAGARAAEQIMAYASEPLPASALEDLQRVVKLDAPPPARWDELARLVARINQERLVAAPTFLTFRRGFHGKTAGAYALTDRTDAGEEKLGAGVDRLEPVTNQSLLSVLKRYLIPLLDLSPSKEHPLETTGWCRVAAIFVEPVQSEGGVHPLDPDVLAALRAEATRHGVPIVADEIQCGFGRCGSFTVSERVGLDPDYVLLGKALGGSVAKLASMSAPADAENDEFARHHSSTFADDDLSAIAGEAALAMLDAEDVPRRTAILGKRLRAMLEDIRRRHAGTIADIRGAGCLLGVDLNAQDESGAMLALLGDDLGVIAAGFLLHYHRIRVLPTLSAPRVLRIEPSAFLGDEALVKIQAGFEDLCDTLARGDLERLLRHLGGEAVAVAPSIVTSASVDEADPAAPTVGFLSYLLEPRDLAQLDPRFSALQREQQEKLLTRLHRQLAPRVVRRHLVRSRTGDAVNVVMIGLGVSSDLIEGAIRRGDTDWLRSRVREGVALARKEGCSLVGLGGYLSIVTNNCLEVLDPAIGLTSGNTLTVAMALEAVRVAAAALNLDLSRARVAVVGGTGNIGSALAELLAPAVGRLDLVGRVDRSPPLLAIAERLRAVTGREVRCGTMQSLMNAEVIVSATSAPHPVVEGGHLGTRARIVCDVAVPADVDPALGAQRPDIRIVRGGAVLLPERRGRDFTLGNLPPDTVYACMGETILLGLEGHRHDFSVGAVQARRVEAVLARARYHGFGLVPPENEAGHRVPNYFG